MSRATWQNLYLVISGAIFLLVAVFHLLPLLYVWAVVVGTWTVPPWLSYLGFPVASGYCVWACWLLVTGRRALVNAGTSGRRDRAMF